MSSKSTSSSHPYPYNQQMFGRSTTTYSDHTSKLLIDYQQLYCRFESRTIQPQNKKTSTPNNNGPKQCVWPCLGPTCVFFFNFYVFTDLFFSDAHLPTLSHAFNPQLHVSTPHLHVLTPQQCISTPSH
jgi:hypothetical protein